MWGSSLNLVEEKRTVGQQREKGGPFARVGLFRRVRTVLAWRYSGAGRFLLRMGKLVACMVLRVVIHGYMVEEIDTGIEMREDFERSERK